MKGMQQKIAANPSGILMYHPPGRFCTSGRNTGCNGNEWFVLELVWFPRRLHSQLHGNSGNRLSSRGNCCRPDVAKAQHRLKPCTCSPAVIVTKFANSQRWPPIHRCIDCLCSSVAGLKTSLYTSVAGQPSGAVSLQKSCDFPLGKIGPVHVRIAFRNALLIGKLHHVEISAFSVNDAYTSIVTQTSLNNCAI